MKSNALRHAVLTLDKAAADKALSMMDRVLVLELLPQCQETQEIRSSFVVWIKRDFTEEYIGSADLAVLFLALATLQKYDSTVLTGNELALAVKRLVDAEDTAGGPYCVGGTPDIAANACVALCMKRMSVALPNVDAFLSPLTAILQPEPRLFSDALLAYIYSHCNMLTPTPSFAIYPGNLVMKAPLYRGQDSRASKCLQTVLDARNQEEGAVMANDDPTESYASRQATIFAAAHSLFASTSDPLRRTAARVMARIARADGMFEISLLPAYFYESLRNPANKVRAETLITLGVANVYTWAAYTVYDDFLDGSGEPAMMPIAHMSSRESLRLYCELVPGNRQLQEYVRTVYRTMDEANAWEAAYGCYQVRLPYIIVGTHTDYGTCDALSDRSLAHILGPMCILALQGIPLDSPVASSIHEAFRQYLIARQLNDDAHDWAEDMYEGHITYVVAAILRDMQLPPGKYRLERLLPAMQGCFWSKTSAAISEKMLQHVAAARSGFAESNLFQDRYPMEQLLESIERSAKRARSTQRQGHEFLHTFSKQG